MRERCIVRASLAAQESMRCLPVLSGTNRTSDKDIMLGGFCIPRGTMIWCNLNATMSNPDLWDNPEQFMPVSARPSECFPVLISDAYLIRGTTLRAHLEDAD